MWCSYTDFKSLMECGTTFVNGQLIPVLASIAFILFLWGVFIFIHKAGEETAREEGKKLMIWGIVALTVLFCLWSLVGVLSGTFGKSVHVPQVGTVSF